MAKAKPNNEMDWDLTSYFPEFNGPEMLNFKAALRKDLAALRKRV